MVLEKKKHWICFGILMAAFAALTWRLSFYYAEEPGVFWRRMEIVVLIVSFLVLHCFLDIKKMYQWIYKYRFWIAVALFVFCVLNCFSLSSVGMYNSYIQPNEVSQFGMPIFGTPRGTRSDEWLVNITRMMAGWYEGFGTTNDIVRGTMTSGMSATGGLMFDYAALRMPSQWGYYLFGPSYGVSFYWSFEMIFGALIIFEFFMIVTKKKPLYALLGCALVWFSSFNMWWSIATLMMAAFAIMVFFYYMIIAEGWKRRLLFGTLLAIAGAEFCTTLYPAWQVPLGWLIVAFIVWILIQNKQWKKYRWTDWAVIVLDIVFMTSIILRFLHVDADYMQAVTSTVYPGKRISYGGNEIGSLFGYIQEFIMPIYETGNASDAGTFFGVFPLGFILSIYVLIKQKGKNTLLWCLLIPATIYFFYCTVSLPSFVAEMFLLTNSIPLRLVGILGICLSILTVVSFAEMDADISMKPIWAALIALGCLVPVYFHDNTVYDSKKIALLAILVGIGTAIVIYMLLTKHKEAVRKGIIVGMSVILMIDGMLVNPITVGLDAITEKPLYHEVRKIIEGTSEQTLWIGNRTLILGDYLIACGAPTLNSTNYVPNKELWKILDPKNEKEDVWNRYAHVNLVLSDTEQTEITLQQFDYIIVQVSLKDFLALHVDYILSDTSIPDCYDQYLDAVYSGDGATIFKVKE